MENIQALNEVKDQLKICLDKYTNTKILYDAICYCAFDRNILNSDLQGKLQNIIHESNNYKLNSIKSEGNNLSANSILGLTSSSSDSQKLSYNECISVNKALLEVLEKNYNSIIDTTADVGLNTVAFSNVSIMDMELDDEDNTLFELKSKVDEQHKMYISNLLQEQQILENLVNLRLQNLKAVCEDKVTDYTKKLKMNSLRMDLLQKNSKVNVFMETTSVLPACEELLKDIKVQQQECQIEIQHFKQLKDKYKNIMCTQYEDILKSYLQCKSAIEQKKMVLETLGK